jgi:ubiquinone biosynthesis protein
MAPSAAMFNDLMKVLFTFSLSLPADFSTFFRAFVTLEGTLTTFSPGFSVIDAAQDIGGELARSRLAPASLSEFARDEVLHLAPLLRRLPRHIDRLATIAARGDFRARVSLLSSDEDARLVTKLLNRTILAFFGGVVGVISVMLIGIQGGPEFTGDTTLYQFFGYFGLFCSSILIMRVLIAIFHERLN